MLKLWRIERTQTPQTIALTLMAIRPGESLLTLAAEVPTGMTSTATVRTTNARGDESRAARSAVRRHGNRATVNHCGNNKDRVIESPFGTDYTHEWTTT